MGDSVVYTLLRFNTVKYDVPIENDDAVTIIYLIALFFFCEMQMMEQPELLDAETRC